MFPHQVRQVFFSEDAVDAVDARWKVVLHKDSLSSRVHRPNNGVVVRAAPVKVELEAHKHVVRVAMEGGHVPDVICRGVAAGA